MPHTKTVHAIFDGNVLRPEESIDMELNVRYLVTIERKEDTGQKNRWDTLNKFSGKVEGLEDWSKEHDHYFYGGPKREKGHIN